MNDTTFQGTGKVISVPVIVGKPQKQTHYDEIRSMSVEEMAKWLKAYAGCNHFNDKEWCYRNKNCEQCWLDYLNLEVNDGRIH